MRNLLSNDSGRFWSLQSDYGDLLRARSRTTYAVGLTQQYAPGSAWAYNNAAIQVLEPVLEKATGMRVARFARERLFEPLGMTHTSSSPTAPTTPPCSTGCGPRASTWRGSASCTSAAARSTGAGCSTRAT